MRGGLLSACPVFALVGAGACVRERPDTLFDGRFEGYFADHVQHGFVLTREAGVLAVLAQGRRADRHRATAQAAILLGEVAGQVARPGTDDHEARRDAQARFDQPGEPGGLAPDAGAQRVVADLVETDDFGLGGDGESLQAGLLDAPETGPAQAKRRS